MMSHDDRRNKEKRNLLRRKITLMQEVYSHLLNLARVVEQIEDQGVPADVDDPDLVFIPRQLYYDATWLTNRLESLRARINELGPVGGDPE